MRAIVAAWLPPGAHIHNRAFTCRNRDARIVGVEIAPGSHTQRPQQLQRLGPQPGVAQCWIGSGIQGDGGGQRRHLVQRIGGALTGPGAQETRLTG